MSLRSVRTRWRCRDDEGANRGVNENWVVAVVREEKRRWWIALSPYRPCTEDKISSRTQLRNDRLGVLSLNLKSLTSSTCDGDEMQ